MNNEMLVKLGEVMKKDNVDALMVAPGNDMVFLLGTSTHLCERFQALIIKNDGDYFYICNLLTVDEAKDMIPGHDVYGWFDGETSHRLSRRHSKNTVLPARLSQSTAQFVPSTYARWLKSSTISL